MAGPWEKYKAPAETPSGPWAKYAAPATPEAAPVDQPSTLMDMAKSGAAGAVRGIADAIGFPGTISDAMHSAGDWALKKGYHAITGEVPEPGTFFGGPSEETKAGMIGGGGNPLSGEVLKKGLSALTAGATDYQPRTVPGEYARTIGEFVPNAVGPGGLVRKAAQVAVPAVLSEIAGQSTKGTTLEPYSRIVAALIGGGVSNIGAGSALPALPSAKDIFAQGGNAFEAAKPILKDVHVTNGTYRSVIDTLKDQASDFGIVPEAHGPVASFLKRHDNAANAANAGAEPSLWDLETARRSLGHIGNSNTTNPSLGALSSKLTGTLDDAVEKLGASNLKIGDPTEADKALETLATARQTWRTGIKSEMVEKAIEQAQNSASGVENGLRIEFRKLLKDKVAKNFDETELDAIKQVARGTVSQNALRWLGGFGVPTDSGRNFLGSVAGALSGNAVGGPVGAVALPAIGTAAKVGASSIAERNAAVADALIKSGPAGRDLYQQSMGALKGTGRLAILRALLQSQSAAQVPLSTTQVRQ